MALIVKQAQSVGVDCLAERRGDSTFSLGALLDMDRREEMAAMQDEEPSKDDSAEVAVVAQSGAMDIVAVANFEEYKEPGQPPKRLDAFDGSRVVTLLLTTTDAGSDEAYARRLLQTMFIRAMLVWVLERHCLQHQCDLMIFATIKIAS